MRFEINAIHAPGDAPTIVEAESWFVAFQKHLQRIDVDLAMHQLAFTVREDGISALAKHKESGREWRIHARIATPEAVAYFVSQMRQTYWLLKPYGWLFLLAGGLVGGGVYSIGKLIQLPLPTLWTMTVLAGCEVALWLWLGLACKIGIPEKVEREHWQLDRVRRSALFSSAIALLVAATTWLICTHISLSIWRITGLVLLAFAAALFGFYRGVTWLLIQGEFRGLIAPGKAGRWLGWTTAGVAFVFGAVLFGLSNFVGGMHWWYSVYVSPERTAEVTARAKTLRALQLQTLRDRRGRYLGLYAKSESDWSRYYNDPNLLDWPVSQAIQTAEGAVPSPSWWWRYLPDGAELQSEPFSLKAFLRVPYYFLKQRRKVGGSTPTLQAAKNFMDFGQKRRNKGLLGTIGLKLFVEIPRAYIMAQQFTPREMLATYMATIWAGKGGNYGLHRMSIYYFGQPNPTLLTWNQSAVLAASLPNPGRFNPWFLKACRTGTCQNPRRAKVYQVWLTRIRQIKQALRRQGHNIPKTMPIFCNGMGRMRVLSKKWLFHDAHIRRWIRQELPQTTPKWQQSSVFQLGYDHDLTVGPKGVSQTSTGSFCNTPTKITTPQPTNTTTPQQSTNTNTTTKATTPTKAAKATKATTPTKVAKATKATNLIGIVREQLNTYRNYIPDLQIAYTLANANDGMIVSQYGGDQHVDMALAKKPVVGSTFKVLTLLISEYWPDRLPLLNQGRDLKKRYQKRFLYQPHDGSTGHIVRNSHSMARFVGKRAALSMSANIAFVFLSLRWTWLIDRKLSQKVMRIGLTQMYQERLKLSPQAAAQRAQEAMQSNQQLLADLRGPLGYRTYLKKWQTRALFEAGKGLAVQELIQRRNVSPQTLALLLDTESLQGFGTTIQHRWAHHRSRKAQQWKAQPDWEWLSWIRPLRMELGLRYIIYLAGLIANFDRKADHLQPVMTMTLGVNNADTKQLAGVAATVAAGRLIHPKIIQLMRRGKKQHYHTVLPTEALPIPKSTLPKIQEAMNSVLRWGTASRAGRYVAKYHGLQWLKRSGAKTGTVQRSKGVSCIGYLGHHAGALTISTPNNRPLIQYTLRRVYLQQHAHAALQTKRYLQCMQQASPLSNKARWCERKWRSWQKRTLALHDKNEEYMAKAKEYIRTERIWKRSELKAAIFARTASRMANQARLKRRQAEVYQTYIKGEMRMIQLYDKWFERFDRQTQEQRQKAQKQFETANQLYHKAQSHKLQVTTALRVLKETLRAKKPHKRKTPQNRREWTKLVRQLMQMRHQLRRANYQARIFKNRRKHAQHRATIAQHRLVNKTPRYRENQRKKKHNQQRLKGWKQQHQATLQAALALDRRQQQAISTQRQWLQQAAKEEAQYNRLEAIVQRTHKRWSLYSSDACALLFQLLGQWKNYEQSKGNP